MLLQGGFHRTVKYSTETTFVGGLGGGFMALLFLALSFIAGLEAVRGLAAERSGGLLLFAVVFLPVGVFALTR